MSSKDVLNRLKVAAATCESWADFSNDLFSGEGLLRALLPDEDKRSTFFRANRSRLKKLMDAAIARHGFHAGAAPKRRTANFVLRLPVSLHRELKNEAQGEGVSLNQLMILKLAAQLKHPIYESSGRK